MKFALAVSAAAVTFAVTAAPARAEIQAWQVIQMLGRVEEHGSSPSAWLDLQLRRRGDSTQYLVRPALGWAITQDLFVHAGYAYIPTDLDDGATATEQRIWQQVIYNGTIDPQLKYQLRGRAEQRFGPDAGVGVRLRALGRLQWQASQRAPVHLVVWDEVFFGVNETTNFKLQGFDQNRTFAGIAIDTKLRGMRFEAGYLYLLTQAGDRSDHVIAFFANVNTWLRSTPRPK
ncbi:MAG: DUF2490 domain-containing protein [Deltaproteobacteria bacterium]|nr:DUF2490 domain-containing protein [Deltaproteobacteria bacterium]